MAAICMRQARCFSALRLPRRIAVATARRGFAGAETHGGDDIHKVERLVCDFSVTTNALGPVPGALDAVRRLFENGDHASAGVWSMPFNKGDARQSGNQAGECTGISGEVSSNAAIEHYPKRADDELELLTAAFLRGDANAEVTRSQLIFGNGASELIDLL
ncbi:cobD, partial [Symbiodinium microadriaticum]